MFEIFLPINITSLINYLENVYSSFGYSIQNRFKVALSFSQGENLNAASSETDIVVTIGSHVCPVETVSQTSIYCTPPNELLREESGPFEVTVSLLLHLFTVHIMSYI